MSLLLASLFACTTSSGPAPLDTGSETVERGDCNPVEASLCLLPYPSDFFLREDPSTETGRRLDFGPTSLPRNIDGLQMAPDFWNELDGYSTLGKLLAHLPEASLEGVIP